MKNVEGPVAVAAAAAGIPMLEIARRMGVDYDAVKQWNGRGRVPAKYREAFEAALKSE